MTNGGLVIRCDANVEIGAGHFFRELALAEAAVDRGLAVVIAMSDPPAAYRDIAAESNVEVRDMSATPGSHRDARELIELAESRAVDAVVIDGYHFDTSYYEVFHSEDVTLAAVDDIAHQRFPVDVLVNLNPHASDLHYDVPEETRLLLGVDYALLRRQFRQARAQLDASGGPEVPEQLSRIIVTMGGGDCDNETTKVLTALQNADYAGRADVVIGPSNPNRDKLKAQADESPADIRLHSNVRMMAELMAGQHLAICGSGGTSWELCCLGVPMMQVAIAENQRRIAEFLDARDLAEFVGMRTNLGEHEICDALTRLDGARERRARMVDRMMRLVDGGGADRVLRAVRE